MAFLKWDFRIDVAASDDPDTLKVRIWRVEQSKNSEDPKEYEIRDHTSIGRQPNPVYFATLVCPNSLAPAGLNISDPGDQLQVFEQTFGMLANPGTRGFGPPSRRPHLGRFHG